MSTFGVFSRAHIFISSVTAKSSGKNVFILFTISFDHPKTHLAVKSDQHESPFPSEFLHGYSGSPPLTGPLLERFTYDRDAIGTAEPGIQPQTLMAFRLSDHVATRCVFGSPPCDPIKTVGYLDRLVLR